MSGMKNLFGVKGDVEAKSDMDVAYTKEELLTALERYETFVGGLAQYDNVVLPKHAFDGLKNVMFIMRAARTMIGQAEIKPKPASAGGSVAIKPTTGGPTVVQVPKEVETFHETCGKHDVIYVDERSRPHRAYVSGDYGRVDKRYPMDLPGAVDVTGRRWGYIRDANRGCSWWFPIYTTITHTPKTPTGVQPSNRVPREVVDAMRHGWKGVYRDRSGRTEESIHEERHQLSPVCQMKDDFGRIWNVYGTGTGHYYPTFNQAWPA